MYNLKKENRKDTIISAARRLFSRFGLEKTTMEDIAKATKKAKSSLYYYFKGKEEVFAEVINREMHVLKKIIKDGIEKEDSSHAKLKKFVSIRMKYLKEKSDHYTSIRDEYLKHYEFIENLREEYSNWEIAEIKSILQFGIENGELEITDIELISKSIFFAIKGLEYPWIINLTPVEIEKSVNNLFDVLFKGLNKK